MQLKFTRKGTGSQAVILLHGWGGSLASLAPLQEELSRGDFTVYNIEFPGSGDSPPPPMPMKMKNYVWLIDRMIDELNLFKPILVGHSFGGKTALAYASKYPGKISRLVLINSSGLKPQNTIKKCILYVISKSFGPILRTGPLQKLYNFFRKIFYRFIVRESDYLKANAMRPTLVNVLNEHLDDTAPTVRVPTLLIWGEKDSSTPLWMGKKLEELIPDSRLEIVKDEKHNLPLVRPELISNFINLFK